jgi:sensor histidine kinase YesM
MSALLQPLWWARTSRTRNLLNVRAVDGWENFMAEAYPKAGVLLRREFGWVRKTGPSTDRTAGYAFRASERDGNLAGESPVRLSVCEESIILVLPEGVGTVRNLRSEIIIVYSAIALLFMGTFFVDSSFYRQLLDKNGELLQNYRQINQAMVEYNHSSTAFRLYNRNRDHVYYEEYEQGYRTVEQLLSGLSDAFKTNDKTILYSRTSLYMLQEQNRLIGDYADYKANNGSFSEDYEWITLMGTYITESLGELLSAYIEEINRQNAEAISLFDTFHDVANVLRVVFLFLLVVPFERIVRKSKQKMAETSHAMQEIGKQNFEVEDIKLTAYDDINEFIVTTNTMKREIRDLIAEIGRLSQREIEHEQQKRLFAESRFKMLQIQIKPHFLFNTLSMIIRHIQAGEKETSIRLVEETSQLLRSSLHDKMTVTLDEELELLRSYLFIQRLLLQDRIDLFLDIRRGYGTATVAVPPMTIQPIIENAVIHGLQDTREGGLVDIQVVEKPDRFEVSVSDNGVGMDEKLLAEALHEKEGHFGLSSVYQRLCLLYQREDVMEIESTPKKGTRVLLRFFKEVS